MEQLRTRVSQIQYTGTKPDLRDAFEDNRTYVLTIINNPVYNDEIKRQLEEYARIWSDSRQPSAYQELGACCRTLLQLKTQNTTMSSGTGAGGDVQVVALQRQRITGSRIQPSSSQRGTPTIPVDPDTVHWLQKIWSNLLSNAPSAPTLSAGAGGGDVAQMRAQERAALFQSFSDFMSRLRPSIELFMEDNQYLLHFANLVNIGYIVYSGGGPGLTVPDIDAITRASNISNTSMTILMDLLISDVTRGDSWTVNTVMSLASPGGITGDGRKLVEHLRTLTVEDFKSMKHFSLYENIRDKRDAEYYKDIPSASLAPFKARIGDVTALKAIEKCNIDNERCLTYRSLFDTMVTELNGIRDLPGHWASMFVFIYYLLSVGLLALSYYFYNKPRSRKPLTEAEKVEFGRRRTPRSRRKSSKRNSFGRRRKNSTVATRKASKKNSFGRKRKVSRKKNSRK